MTNGKRYIGPMQDRLILPSAGKLVSYDAQALDILDADGIAVLFELLEADINFDGLSVPVQWFAAATSWQQAEAIERAVNRDYPPTSMAGIRIEGVVRASDAVHWLRMLRLRTHNGPTKQTTMALLKR